MGFIAKYPYTDFHELNLDYLLQVIKSVETTLRDFVSLNAIKYADPIQWNITRQYEKNTVVIDPLTGTAYISVAPVPIGAALTRTEYWTVVFDLEQFVTKASENFANTYEAQTTTTATQATPQYGWIVWGGILYVANTTITPGDAYVVGGNITRITVEDICGHIETLNTTDKSNLVAAVNEVLASLISTAGDLNNLTTTDKSNLVAAINEVITTFDAAVLAIQTDMGDLATLATSDKTSLVNAINEVLTTLASVAGDLATLTTTDKTSLVNAINEVVSDLAAAISTIDGVTGDLANLTTTDKTSLVNAINEVVSDLAAAISTIDGVTGDLANLTTTDKTSLVNAINEVNGAIAAAVLNMGDLANLTTTDKTSLVNAINEVVASGKIITTPQQFGAVGDGVTDDTQALQDAITHCTMNHVPLFIPVGTYLFNATLQINQISVYGFDATLKYTGSGNAIEIINGFNSTVEGFALITSTGNYGIYADGRLNHSILNHLYIVGFNEGLHLINSYLCRITNVITEECANYGMYISDAFNASIEHIRTTKSNVGVYLESGSSVRMSDVDCSAALTYGMQLDYVYGGVIENIYYEDQAGYNATSVIYAGPNGLQNTNITGLFMSLASPNVSYIHLDGSNGAYIRFNRFSGIVINSNDASQSLFEFSDYGGYKRVYANIMDHNPTEVNVNITLFKGNGDISIISGHDNMRHDYSVVSDVITDRGSYARFVKIDTLTDGSGNWGVNYPAGVTRDNITLIEARNSLNEKAAPTNIMYYSTAVSGAGLSANETYSFFLMYTV